MSCVYVLHSTEMLHCLLVTARLLADSVWWTMYCMLQDYCNSIIAIRLLHCINCTANLDAYPVSTSTEGLYKCRELLSLWVTCGQMLMRFPVGQGSQFQILPITLHLDRVFTLGNQTLAKSPGGRNHFWQLLVSEWHLCWSHWKNRSGCCQVYSVLTWGTSCLTERMGQPLWVDSCCLSATGSCRVVRMVSLIPRLSCIPHVNWNGMEVWKGMWWAWYHEANIFSRENFTVYKETK